MLGIKSVKNGNKALSCFFVVCIHLCNEHNRAHRVLIPCMCADKIAVAFLHTHYKVVGAVHFLADVFEAGKYLFYGRAVFFSYRECHIGGNDSLDNGGGISKRAERSLALEHIVHKKNTGFVSVKKSVISVIIAHNHANTVCIWVGCYNKLCPVLFCLFECQGERRALLGVRIRTSRKIRIRLFLLGHYHKVRNADIVKYFPDRYISRAVKRCI